MIKQLLYKWFGLSDEPCESCEILRTQLEKSDRERNELLHRLLDKDKSEPPIKDEEEMKPVKPTFIPWRIKQQMLEAEDRKQMQLLKDKHAEIEKLEKEVGIAPSN